MVNLTSETLRIVQIILTIGIMIILLGTTLFLDYFNKKEKRTALILLTTILYSCLTALLVIAVIEITMVMTVVIEIVLFVITLAIMFVIIGGILLSDHFRKGAKRVLFVGVLTILFGLLVYIVATLWIEGTVEYSSLHLGPILGLPALILVTTGTIIVIFDESKFSLYHGFSAGGAWVLTLTNVIALLALSQDMMKGYSGWLHAFHIVCGGAGLTFGFASALFGLSGQRRLAKVTGYTTLGCWWVAYLLGFFIVYGNI